MTTTPLFVPMMRIENTLNMFVINLTFNSKKLVLKKVIGIMSSGLRSNFDLVLEINYF
jgi:hypothetical protein